MLKRVESSLVTNPGRRTGLALSATFVLAASAVFEALAIFVTGLATAAFYHWMMYDAAGHSDTMAAASALAALIFCATFVVRGDYSTDRHIDGNRTNSITLVTWSLAFVALVIGAFLTKSSDSFSRGWLVLFYLVGFVVLVICNRSIRTAVIALMNNGKLARRKVLIVGKGADINLLEREINDGAAGTMIAGKFVLPESNVENADEEFDTALDFAIEDARILGIEDVIISSAVDQTDVVQKVVQAFSLLPVAIHWGAGGFIGRFRDAHVGRIGRATLLSLMRQPLSAFESLGKRMFDIFTASLALLLLAPLFAVIALVVKLDSRGPVFFRQRRRGYNHEEFLIWKFRTMTTAEDGDVVRQASRNDARVTGVGRFLRKYSLDELPQLMNVIAGDMSLVGPRPHAVAHDKMFEKRLRNYPRRLNMKPGITGWAQVNGFRGATETENAMEQRLEHDLFYIDNWSLSFDIYILFLTVVSPRASMNAY